MGGKMKRAQFLSHPRLPVPLPLLIVLNRKRFKEAKGRPSGPRYLAWSFSSMCLSRIMSRTLGCESLRAETFGLLSQSLTSSQALVSILKV